MHIKTFLKQNTNFVSVEDYSGKIPDADYIEGAIELEISGIFLIGVESWDYVDQLWAYIVAASKQSFEGKECEFYFPDQPIHVKFKPMENEDIEISVEADKKRSAKINKKLFFNSIFTEANMFLNHLMLKVPKNKNVYTNILNELKVMSRHLN